MGDVAAVGRRKPVVASSPLTPEEFERQFGTPRTRGSHECALKRFKERHPVEYGHCCDGWNLYGWRAGMVIKYVKQFAPEASAYVTEKTVSHHFKGYCSCRGAS